MTLTTCLALTYGWSNLNLTMKASRAMKKQPKMVVVIKNGLTKQEMKESGERWATHEGPYMTLQEVLDIEAAKQRK